MERVWILGAADPEMERIEALLVAAGQCVAHAINDATAGGSRIRPGEAVASWRYVTDGGNPSARTRWYLVETGPVDIPDADESVIVDHHNPGDPGYGIGPSNFLAASSIGQTVAILADLGLYPGAAMGPCQWSIHPDSNLGFSFGITVDRDIVLAAASDHCPAAAYRGLCPGVDPEELMRWRVESKSQYSGRPIDDILESIRRAMDVIKSAPIVNLTLGEDCTEHWVADIRGKFVADAPEASLRLGIPILTHGIPGRDGRVKVNLLGDYTGMFVTAFLDKWAPRNGIVDTYGDPARGFAGGYQVAAK